MIKWLVIWTVINMWSVPCYDGPLIVQDEYGNKHIAAEATQLMACWETEATQMEREFDNYQDAVNFVMKAYQTYDPVFEIGPKDFIIKRITTEVVE